MRQPFFVVKILIFALLAGCAAAPYTGRSQFMLVSEGQEMTSGEQAYRQILRDSVLSDDSEAVRLVRKVGERIARAANKPEYKWEFRVINDPENVNAFCVPGGKVAVYTGIFPIAQDEAGLAVILGHEVAHALLRHAGERMSQAEILGAGFAIAGADRKFVWAKATILGNKVVVSSDQVAEPVAVRYAWADNPVCNLFSNDGLPVTPFRTDDFEMTTKPKSASVAAKE